MESDSGPQGPRPGEPNRGGPPQWHTDEERWSAVEGQIADAIARGDFDGLPGTGRPLRLPAGRQDPDWWLRQKIEDEGISGLGPEALRLRREDESMDSLLDGFATEQEVRKHVVDFNSRLRQARRQLLGGPPVVTRDRDVEAALEAWRARRESRHLALSRADEADEADSARGPRRTFWNRFRDYVEKRRF